jgi:hypothetical protein
MAAHKRTASESTNSVFVPHALSFAGAGEEQDQYYAAQRYDWDDVPPKLAEPRAQYEPTQPFDYVVPKKTKKGQALGMSNANTTGEHAEAVVVKRKPGRPRKDATLVAVAAESECGDRIDDDMLTFFGQPDTPALSVEVDVTKSLPRKRGRPRRSEASRKTDDGDNTEDVSYPLKLKHEKIPLTRMDAGIVCSAWGILENGYKETGPCPTSMSIN